MRSFVDRYLSDLGALLARLDSTRIAQAIDHASGQGVANRDPERGAGGNDLAARMKPLHFSQGHQQGRARRLSR